MKIFEVLKENKIDVYWISGEYNKRYLTNFSGTTSEVVVTNDKVIIITDGRYKNQVKSEVFDHVEVIITSTSVSYFDSLKNIFDQHHKIGFESNHVTVDALNDLCTKLPNNEFVPVSNYVENLRLIKSADEIEKIRAAVKITDDAFNYVSKNICVGMTEKEVELMANNQQILLGAEKSSFDTILVSAENSAKPHGQASNKVINEGDIVTLDFGCYKDGYVSDMTRTFFVGEPNSDELVFIHDTVLKALNEQIKAVKPGVNTKVIDAIGRSIIDDAGYLENFVHGTGHGIGLEIHEGPYVNKTFDIDLKPGMVITIEPGIYVDGLGGVRIEQDVVVTSDGHEVLNMSYKGHDATKK